MSHSGLVAEASAAARLVAKAIKIDQDDLGTIEAIEAAITRRMSVALSNIPAVRVELAEWLIRESGTDAPGAIVAVQIR